MAGFLSLPESVTVSTGDLSTSGVLIKDATFEWPTPPGGVNAPEPAAVNKPAPAQPRDTAGEDGAGDKGNRILAGATAEAGATGGASGGVFTPPGGAFTLRGVSLSASLGELVVVVGAVGAGKTTLLSALLGDIPAIRGEVNVRGSIAYAPQTPFILGASVSAWGERG
jgi:ABC-type multidrug transport system fused ATPase/permease subunit